MLYLNKKSIIIFVLTIINCILSISLYSYNFQDNSYMYSTTSNASPENILGSFGANIAGFLLYYFGCTVILLLILSFLLSMFLFFNINFRKNIDRIIAVVFLYISLTALCNYYSFGLA